MPLSISKKAGRPRSDATPVLVRLYPAAISNLDAWIAAQPEPRPSRPEAIRRILADALPKAKPLQPASSLDREIAEKKAAIAEMPEPPGPSPEAALAVMDKALAQNELVELKNKRTRRKIAKHKG